MPLNHSPGRRNPNPGTGSIPPSRAPQRPLARLRRREIRCGGIRQATYAALSRKLDRKRCATASMPSPRSTAVMVAWLSTCPVGDGTPKLRKGFLAPSLFAFGFGSSVSGTAQRSVTLNVSICGGSTSMRARERRFIAGNPAPVSIHHVFP